MPQSELRVAAIVDAGTKFTGRQRTAMCLITELSRSGVDAELIVDRECDLTAVLTEKGHTYFVLEQVDRIGDSDGDTLRGGLWTKLLGALEVIRFNARFFRLAKRRSYDIVWAACSKHVLLVGLAARSAGIKLVWDLDLEPQSRGFVWWMHCVCIVLSHKVV